LTEVPILKIVRTAKIVGDVTHKLLDCGDVVIKNSTIPCLEYVEKHFQTLKNKGREGREGERESGREEAAILQILNF
jgi:hypothetical protein